MTASSTRAAAASVRLGLHENLAQFTLLAIVTLALKTLVERQQQKAAAEPVETDDTIGGIIA